MGRTIFVYGFILACVAFLLTWLDYRFWLRDIGFEIYGLVLAVLFAGLGIWIERQRNPRPKSDSATLNQKAIKAIKALGLTDRETEMVGFLAQGKSCLLYTSPSPRDA